MSRFFVGELLKRSSPTPLQELSRGQCRLHFVLPHCRSATNARTPKIAVFTGKQAVPAPTNRRFCRQDLDVYTPILKSVQSIVSASSLSRPYLCVSSLSMLRFAPPHYRFAVNARPPEIPPHFVRCCFAVRFRFAPLRMTRAGGQCPHPKSLFVQARFGCVYPDFEVCTKFK